MYLTINFAHNVSVSNIVFSVPHFRLPRNYFVTISFVFLQRCCKKRYTLEIF